MLDSRMGVFDDYEPVAGFDEAFEAGGVAREPYRQLTRAFQQLDVREFHRRRSLIDLTFRNQGITFTVYGSDEGVERTFPYDPIPRLIPAGEWAVIERGLRQRVRALNLFLADVYGE